METEEMMWGVFRRGNSGTNLASMKPDGEDCVFATEKEAKAWLSEFALNGRVAEVVWTDFGWFEKSVWERS